MSQSLSRNQGDDMNHTAINFEERFSNITQYWSPKIIARMNDYHFKLVRILGDFVWHRHIETDETFIVLKGEMRLDFRDSKVELGPGEMIVVPRGEEHKPFAERECVVMLIEPSGTINTGDTGGELTAEDNVWI